EHAVAKVARRTINAVGDKNVFAGARDGEQCRRNRRQSRWQECDTGATVTVELTQCILERIRGRCAAPAVAVARPVSDLIVSGGIENGRGVVHGWIDKAVIGLRIASRRDQSRIGFDGGFWFFRHMIGTSFKDDLEASRARSRRKDIYVRAARERQPLDPAS